jgi:hypothetical protein
MGMSNEGCIGPYTSLPITVHLSPSLAGPITGPTSVCQYEGLVQYTVPLMNNATYYVWTLPSGEILTDIHNSITINFDGLVDSGNLTVEGFNDCGESSSTYISIEVKHKPLMPSISNYGEGLLSNTLTGNQWYDQLGAIPGATSNEFTPTKSGDYYVIVSKDGCTSDASNVIHYIPTTNHTVSSVKNVRMYPNPASQELIIEIDNNIQNIDFDIINSLGQVVFSGTLVDKTIVQTYPYTSGLYLIRLKCGETIEWKKFVKK